VLEGQLRTFTHFGPDNKFQTLPEYPKTAWYEALVNACVHRSYNLRNMNIFIRMFDDRLEIESPGGFPPLVTPQNIYNTHHPRNPLLFDAMFYLEYVRGSREGTRRIHESMKRWNLPQEEFSEKETGNPFVLVTLRNNYKKRKVLLDSQGAAFISEALFNTLSPDERRAVNYVVEHHKIKPTDLMRVRGGTWHSAKKVLTQLKAKGIFGEKRRKDIVRDSQAYYYLKHPNGREDEKTKIS
jgi:ATP-dependent DNA helicase RecG